MHPMRMFQTLTQACIIIHQGGPGVGAEAIAVGVPQMALAAHIEHELNGLALDSEGIGKMFGAYDPSVSISSGSMYPIPTVPS